MPVCSGLSALIQAATSQFGHLLESDASELSHASPYHHGDGYASSSDCDGRSPLRTPIIVSEEHSSKSMFPELLMSVLIAPENSDIITFLPDGKFFAVRVKEFSNDLLSRRFQLSTFDEFLEQMQGWGFSVISSEEETDGSASNVSERSIQVFRHPHFRRGAPVDLRHVRFSIGEHAPVPGRARIEYSMSDDSSTSAKRRLSPSHVDRDFEETSSKFRAMEDNETSSYLEYGTVASSAFHTSEEHVKQARRRSSTEIRSKALAVTAAHLSLDDGEAVESRASKAERRASLPLADGGLDKATQTIMANAIETLLFDEQHTREMYLKHEKELSKSSLPGVIPISKQLFSPPEPAGPTRAQSAAADAGSPLKAPSTETSCNNTNVGSLSPKRLEAATALIRQAGLKEI